MRSHSLAARRPAKNTLLTPPPGLVRFVPAGDDSKVLIGEPVDSSVDVGLAVRKGEQVQVRVFSGASALEPGAPTEQVAAIGRLLSPLSAEEVGAIRCIGLNVGSYLFSLIVPHFVRICPLMNLPMF